MKGEQDQRRRHIADTIVLDLDESLVSWDGDWRHRVRPIVVEVRPSVKNARSPSATVVRPGLGLTS